MSEIQYTGPLAADLADDRDKIKHWLHLVRHRTLSLYELDLLHLRLGVEALVRLGELRLVEGEGRWDKVYELAQ
jgi:hypothetical protein